MTRISDEGEALYPLTCALEEPHGVLMKCENVDIYPLKGFNHMRIATKQRFILRE
jgi:hypothetical protein